MAYTWDNNGNLTNDGTSTFTYDQANHLKTLTQGTNNYAFAYNGVSDRLSQTVNSVLTRYALDVNAGLTQVLSDGTATYLYGNGRIAQQQTNMQYFGADGLGSVRQLYNSSGQIVANHRYDPFGNTISQSGVGTSNYGFTGEWTDATGLEYLRARYYAPWQGRFVTKDPWEGDYNAPLTLNGWNYVEANPVNKFDPSGLYWWGPGHALWDASQVRAQNQNVHVRIQAIMMIGRMDQIHAEYSPPGTILPIDLLDSVSGEVWEIKPWDDQASALPALEARLATLYSAKTTGRLNGINPVGMEYNWNVAPLAWVRGVKFPTQPYYIGRDDSGWFDIYAAQTQPGVIAWWKYRRLLREFAPYPIVLPEEVTWSARNVRLGWEPATVPVVKWPLFPQPQSERSICPVSSPNVTIDLKTGTVIIGGAVVVGGGTWFAIWLAGKAASWICEPGMPVCAVLF